MITTYFKNMISNHIWHTSSEVDLPGTYYLALSTTEPLKDGTGVTEPDASSGYARIALVDLADAVDGTVTNTTSLSWNELSTDQGVASYWAMFDAPSGGNLLMSNSISTKHLDAGTEIVTKPGKLMLSVLESQ